MTPYVGHHGAMYRTQSVLAATNFPPIVALPQRWNVCVLLLSTCRLWCPTFFRETEYLTNVKSVGMLAVGLKFDPDQFTILASDVLYF